MIASAMKRRVLHPLQRHVLNPLDRLAFRLGIPPPGDALLETVGRRTGQRRVTPVCDGLVGDTFWLIGQNGHRSDWVRNIETNPRVRVKVNAGWRTGTAHILADDDPVERRRMLGRDNFARRLCLTTSGAMSSSPITVRVDLDPGNTGS